MAERKREEAFGALEDFDDMFRRRLKLESKGSSTTDGRTTWKYVVSLGPVVPETGAKLPAPPAPKSGPDETTRRRLRFFELRAPRSLQGEVYVDAKTSVVVRAKLDGRVGVAVDGGDAELRLVLDSTLSDIGKLPAFKVPEDFLPDEDKPLGIAAALERFGIERTDGGVATPRSVDEPIDEGDEPPGDISPTKPPQGLDTAPPGPAPSPARPGPPAPAPDTDSDSATTPAPSLGTDPKSASDKGDAPAARPRKPDPATPKKPKAPRK